MCCNHRLSSRGMASPEFVDDTISAFEFSSSDPLILVDYCFLLLSLSIQSSLTSQSVQFSAYLTIEQVQGGVSNERGDGIKQRVTIKNLAEN